MITHKTEFFLTILFYLVLSDSAKKLANTMGPMTLSKYVKIFDLTILVETFFNKPMYTEDELDTVEVFILLLPLCGLSGEGGDEVDQDPLVGSFCGVHLDVW